MNKEIFNCNTKTATRVAKEIFDELNIKNKCLHCLRHTCSANLYFLGADDKYRQLQLGHSTSVLTNDVYTHLDPTISKKDIINIFKDWYPTF